MLKYSMLGRPVGAVLMVLGLCLLRAQLCNSQGFFILVNPLPDDGATLLSSLQETEYNIFKEGGIRFRCFCHEGIASLSWTHNGVLLAPPTDCDPSNPLTHTVTSASASDSGEYVCEAIFNATASSRIRIQLEVVGSDTIIAPPKQYALINTSASLNCSTTLSKEESNSISISWHRENQPASEVFDSVSLAHEGMYECRLYIALLGLETTRMINFSVIVPPAILQKPSNRYHLLGNQAATIPVRFQSRLREDTVIAWYKNENSAVRKDYIHTEWGEEPFGTTEVRFSNLHRRDSGVYRVVIRNNFEGVPQELRQVDTSFELKVTTLPAAPSNILIENIGSTSAIAQWSLTNQNADDLPDNITARLYYSNGTLAAQYTLDEQETSLPLSLLPGMQYSLHMSAANVDGVSESEPKEFQTPDGAPHPPHVSVERVSNISFHLIVSFLYTGGGNITQLKVSFRRINSQEEWIRLRTVPIVPTGSYLQWRAVVTDETFIEPGVEFKVMAINAKGYISAPVVLPEHIDLPGPPKRPIFASSTHNSVVFQVELSSEGDSPILSLAIDFLSPNTTIPLIYGNYQPGQLVLLTVSGLEASTTYRFTVSAVNYGGKGEPSPAVEATTEELPLLPLYGIVLVSVATALAIIILVVILMLIGRHLYNIQRAKKMYKISGSKASSLKSEGSSSGSGKELVSGTKRPSFPKLSTPSVSSDDSHRSQPNYYSRQGSTSTYPLSPQRTISTSDGGSPIDPSFTFQRHNSVTTSNDSESENNYPRYTYKVSPEPAILTTPTLTTHSHHSMQSFPSSHLTGSTGSSNSTRESLIVTPAEFNSTNV